MQKQSNNTQTLRMAGIVMISLFVLSPFPLSVSAAAEAPDNDPTITNTGNYLDTSTGTEYMHYDAATGTWIGPFPASSSGQCTYTGDWKSSGSIYAGYGNCVNIDVPTRDSKKGYVSRVDVQILTSKSVYWKICVEEWHPTVYHNHCNDGSSPHREGSCNGNIAATTCHWSPQDRRGFSGVTYLCAHIKLWVGGSYSTGTFDCADVSSLPA